MTDVHIQILNLFKSLSFDEREELAQHLYHNTIKTTFFETMTDLQRAHLMDAMAQANRNEGGIASVVFARLRKELPTIVA
ncbi:MAG: hypothetical protein ABL907_16120 [Hyphomicrobium sp.]